MDLTILSLLLGTIVLFIIYLVNCYSYWRKRGIPSPKGTIPLLGHMFPVLTLQKGMTSICNNMYKDFPNASMVGFYNLMRPVLLLREPQLVKTVLQNNFASFRENSLKVNPNADPLMSKSIIFSSGEDWVVGRKHLKNALTGSSLQNLFQSVNGVCKKFVDFLERKLETTDKYEVELKYLFSKFSGEVVANAGFGIEGQCFEGENISWSFQHIGKLLYELDLWSALGHSLALLTPGLNNVLRIGLVPMNVNSFFRTIVRQLLENRKHETVPKNDFFHSMLELETTEGEKPDEELLAARALAFFVDGYDTSSTTLSFIGYHFATHPDIQKNVREEVRSVLSKYNGTMTYESLKEMTYMDQVISESQRRYSAVGLMFKLCTEECELTGSDGLRVRVKPGTEVYIPIHSLQTDPKYWADPETFDPERFNEDRKQNIEKFAYLPFGGGPRLCIGMRMAMLQMKACIATFLNSYSFELSPKTKLSVTLSPSHFLSPPVGGFWVYVKRI